MFFVLLVLALCVFHRWLGHTSFLSGYLDKLYRMGPAAAATKDDDDDDDDDTNDNSSKTNHDGVFATMKTETLNCLEQLRWPCNMLQPLAVYL